MWTTSHSVSIRAGQLDGTAFWNPRLQSYGARLTVFDSSRSYPPPFRLYGTRPGELITGDALANHLAAVGQPLDADSAAALQHLVRVVDGGVGHSEIVGLADGGRRGLFVVGPGGDALELKPAIDHPAYGFHWGDAGEATEETARVIVERVHGRTAAEELTVFALTLTVEFLARRDGDFSVNANSLCDWLLADAALTTSYAAADRGSLRRLWSGMAGGADVHRRTASAAFGHERR